MVDSGSTDHTQELAAAAGAKVVEHAMTNFAEQRNYANTLAKCDWILHLDADERITPELLQEIRSVTATGEEDGFNVPTLNIIFGAPLRHGGWYPSYTSLPPFTTISERTRVGSSGLPNAWLAAASIPDLATPGGSAPLGQLTVGNATPAQMSGSRLSLALRAVLEPGPYFVYKYFVQQGFRDGRRGLSIALLLAFYRCVGYLKALELRSRA